MSLPAPPKRLAAGSAPFTSLRVIASLSPRPNTRIEDVFATVGVPPMTATAPPFTRILPAVSRLITIELPALSPVTVSTPPLNVAVVAALAGTAAPAMTPAASAVAASRRRAGRRQALSRVAFFIISPRGERRPSMAGTRLPLWLLPGFDVAADALLPARPTACGQPHTARREKPGVTGVLGAHAQSGPCAPSRER
jgi:hypothetical protein